MPETEGTVPGRPVEGGAGTAVPGAEDATSDTGEDRRSVEASDVGGILSYH